MSTPVQQSAFAPLETDGRTGAVVRRLRESIHLGLLADGERLPAEVDLAAQLGVATVTLREALGALRQDGLVRTRRGRGGGTFVTAPAELSSFRLEQRLMEFPLQELRDIGDHRAAVAIATAGLAAERASADNCDRLRTRLELLVEAPDLGSRRRADGRFRLEVAAAAQSARLARAEIALQAEIGDLLWLPLEQAGDHGTVVADHRRLVAAIEKGATARARAIAEGRIRAETARLVDYRLAAAKRRLRSRT